MRTLFTIIGAAFALVFLAWLALELVAADEMREASAKYDSVH